MARGYPDFFGHNLFPKYGLLGKQDEQSTLIANGATGTIFTLSQKGVVYGGWINCVLSAGNPSNLTVYFNIDTAEMTMMNPYIVMGNGMFKPGYSLYHILFYDTVQNKVILGMPQGATFGTLFEVKIKNASGANLDIDGELFHYHIT